MIMVSLEYLEKKCLEGRLETSGRVPCKPLTGEDKDEVYRNLYKVMKSGEYIPPKDKTPRK